MADQNPGKRMQKTEHYSDFTLWVALGFLLGFGLIMIYSASSYTAFDSFGDQAYYLKRQGIAVIIGLVAMLVVARIPYHFWTRFATLGYVVSVILIFMVLTPLGVESHGAYRWIGIPGTGFNLQPAEVAKIAMILFLAVLVCKMGSAIRTPKGFMVMMGAPLPIALLIWKVTDNMSSALIVMAISVLMIFVASPDYKKFFLVGFLVLGLAVGVVLLAKNTNFLDGSFRIGRIQAWLDPESDSQDKGFQTLQALYAIGSGGIKGKGLGQSMQKLSFLPESQNDMIFSVICEELGLFGASAVIIMFIILIWRMMIIANNAPDLFGGMLVVGVIGHIAVQAILNIAVVTNTIPNTGISLPFISYGGSSVIFLLVEIGLVLSVARGIQYQE